MRSIFSALVFLPFFLGACSTPAWKVSPPSGAPAQVRRAVVAANSIVGAPYRYGGGHASFEDRAYDCSGTVSVLLHAAGALSEPASSEDLASWGVPGHGNWITVYVKPGRHAFAQVGPYRLDTTDYERGGNVGPRWYLDMRPTEGFEARTLPWL